LSFGVFSWTIPIYNIDEIQNDDEIPVLSKYGGAGIHFMFVRRRYRASFNFLEYSRVVLRLKKKQGLVSDISFSTCQPEELLQIVRGAITKIRTT
jgi:hypothetical protein